MSKDSQQDPSPNPTREKKRPCDGPSATAGKRLAVGLRADGDGSRSSPGAGAPSSSVVPAFVDVCETIGLKPGDRVEVMWDLHYDDDENGDDGCAVQRKSEGPSKANGAEEGVPQAEKEHGKKVLSRWWGATLLAHDGRTQRLECGDDDEDEKNNGSDGLPRGSSEEVVEAATHVLDYDPYPPNFPDRSLEDVVFLSDRTVLLCGTGGSAHWRREGDVWEPGPNDEGDGATELARVAGEEDNDDDVDCLRLPRTAEGVGDFLNTILTAAFRSSGVDERMRVLPAAQQAAMAEKVARTKEAMVEKMMAASEGRAFTADDAQRCMEEIGREMREREGLRL